MNKSSRHKGYYTQNIKCLRIRAKHNMKKEGDRVMSKLLRRSGSQLASQKTTHVYSAIHSHARRGPECTLFTKTLMHFPYVAGLDHSLPSLPRVRRQAFPHLWMARCRNNKKKTCLFHICRRRRKATMTNFLSWRFRRPATV